MVKDLNLNKLKVGSTIIIGDTIQEITEIGKSCFPECNIIKKGEICPLASEALFTRVKKGGNIKIGDYVNIKDSLYSYVESYKYVNQIVDSIPLGYMISDLYGNIEIVNKQMLDMFGYRMEDIKGKRVLDLFKGWATVKNLITSYNTFTDEEVLVNAKTNKVRFNLNASPLLNYEGEVVGIIYIFNDVKKERKLANKLMGRQAIYTFDKIIGNDEGFKRLIDFSKEIADSRSTILITGESGTGKEILAQSIHNYSNRREEPFVAINSGAIPKSLIESELFGYEEGAFTGAKKGGQPGKFEIADKGTIFLDEIGEMPYDMQTRLLRVIEEGTISRVGATSQKVVDVRIIAASNRDLEEEVRKGNFRKDLFYRLNVLPIEIPPLRKRKGDIPLLVDYFMEKISMRLNKKKVHISKTDMDKLMDYKWPGNIRELENLIELIVNVGYIPTKITEGNLESDIKKDTNARAEELSLDYVEKIHIAKVLKMYSGNITHAAKVLGIGRNTLYRKIKKHGIE
ncbi:MAG: sigma 54-interacting transcriptional regulator [Tissierellia bacterium]|nr:sigma 54-interacting transcriptional regulator [Tissierellia bacterium]